MKKLLLIILLIHFQLNLFSQEKPIYLIDNLYTADPSVHVFNNKIFIYPSHDIETEITNGENGEHYNMKDYHVFSMDSINGKVTDHGGFASII